MKKIILSSLVILGLSGTAAFAQTPTTFAELDVDGNGELSLAELQVAWPDLTEAEFSGADANASGGLHVDELNTLQPAAVPSAPAATDSMAPAPTDSVAPLDVPPLDAAPSEEPAVPESLVD